MMAINKGRATPDEFYDAFAHHRKKVISVTAADTTKQRDKAMPGEEKQG